MSEGEYREGPGWNMAALQYQSLRTLLDEANQWSIEGDLTAWRRALFAVLRELAVVGITRQEYKKIAEQLRKAGNILSMELPGSSAASRMSVNYHAEQKIEDVDYEIRQIIRKYKLVFPDKPEKGIEAMYKALKLKKGRVAE